MGLKHIPNTRIYRLYKRQLSSWNNPALALVGDGSCVTLRTGDCPLFLTFSLWLLMIIHFPGSLEIIFLILCLSLTLYFSPGEERRLNFPQALHLRFSVLLLKHLDSLGGHIVLGLKNKTARPYLLFSFLDSPYEHWSPEILFLERSFYSLHVVLYAILFFFFF